jgi:hypothetical protein
MWKKTKLNLEHSFVKYLKSSEMWCWTRMETRWTDRVKIEEALYTRTIKDDRNIIRKIGSRITRLVTSFVGSAFENTLLKGWEDEDPKEKKIYWKFR